MNFIAIDWGSSNLRGWRVENGQCVAHLHSDRGIKTISDQQFEAELLSFIAPWREWIEANQIPLLMAGMVGSDLGWLDSGYQLLPMLVTEIATGMISLPCSLKTQVWLRPGLAVNEPRQANVMRGEEVQFLGALKMQPADVYLLPGTHSKWIQPLMLEGDIYLNRFSTIMTGELYQLLMNHSLIGQGVPDDGFCREAFATGVLEAGQDAAAVIRQIFYGRSRRVLGFLAEEQVSSWLSGLLIGHELTQLKACYAQGSQFALVGDLPLADYYRQAAELSGCHAVIVDAQSATLNGFRSIYAAL